MGRILEDALKDLVADPIDEQIRKICDQIQKEEVNEFTTAHQLVRPKGPNIFLSLPVDAEPEETSFLCLEREEVQKYIISVRSTKNKDLRTDKPAVKRRVWEVEQNEPKKIIEEFVKKLIFMRGK